jgi:hypothetical protein
MRKERNEWVDAPQAAPKADGDLNEGRRASGNPPRFDQWRYYHFSRLDSHAEWGQGRSTNARQRLVHRLMHEVADRAGCFTRGRVVMPQATEYNGEE